MKTRLTKVLTFLLYIGVLTITLTACHEDEVVTSGPNPVVTPDPTPEPEKVNDEDAGVFTLVNVTRGEAISDANTTVYQGDTIKITFTPKTEYKNLEFEFTPSSLKEQEDGSLLYIVPLQNKSDANDAGIVPLELSVVASYNKGDDTHEYNLKANHTANLAVGTYVRIVYDFSITPDMKDFVTPEFSYTDDEGNTHTVAVSEDDYEATMIYVMRNAEGEEIEEMDFLAEKLGEDWTKVSEYVYDYSCDIPIYYHRLNTDCHVTLNFKRKAAVELAKEKYSLRHYLSWGRVEVSIPWLIDHSTYINMNFYIGDDSVKKEKVDDFIDKLVSTPTTLSLHIDENGKISEIRE